MSTRNINQIIMETRKQKQEVIKNYLECINQVSNREYFVSGTSLKIRVGSSGEDIVRTFKDFNGLYDGVCMLLNYLEIEKRF